MQLADNPSPTILYAQLWIYSTKQHASRISVRYVLPSQLHIPYIGTFVARLAGDNQLVIVSGKRWRWLPLSHLGRYIAKVIFDPRL